MKLIFVISFLSLLFSCNTTSEVEDLKLIRQILNNQQQAWSENNIEAFMQGYWKSDSLKFYGAAGLTTGWQQTLDNYKKRYPTQEEKGILEFTIDDISKINKDAYWVMGQYHLTRKINDAHGTFLIIFKRINGEWKIVADSSC